MRHDQPPDFLGIGGTRCGTTWLYEALRVHPQLWLPPVKELHYFDRSPAYHSPSHLAAASLRDRLLADEAQHREWRHEAARDLLRAPAHPRSLPWKARYYLGAPDDAWYRSLFLPGRGKVSGEITPSYAFLSRADVAHVHELAPNARILYVLRNPVERMWSGYRRQGLTDAQIRRRLDQPSIGRRADYLSALATWGSVYPARQIHVDFYDGIAADPVGLLTRVFQFLGVEASARVIPQSITRRTNAAPARPMPEDVRLALTRRYLPLMRELSARFGGHADSWLAVAHDVLARHAGHPE